MTKVKICGITNLQDAQAAVDAGADAIGFVFAESPRRIPPQKAHDVWQFVEHRRRPDGTEPCVAVGVFVDEHPDRVVEVARFVGLHCVQLHGGEPPETVTALRALGLDVVKSFRVSAGEDLTPLRAYDPTAYLLDTFVAGRPGGTGRTFDWRVAVEAQRLGRVIVSGGLGPDNVRDVLRVARPYGVDGSSRLELRPGVKDHQRVREFIRLVKSSASPDAPGPWPR